MENQDKVKCKEDCMQRGNYTNCCIDASRESCPYYTPALSHEEIEKLELSIKRKLERMV